MQSARTAFDVSQVTLHVRKSNEPAIGLYTSLEFYTMETKPGFCESVSLMHTDIDEPWYIDDDGEDAFTMTLVLRDDVNT